MRPAGKRPTQDETSYLKVHLDLVKHRLTDYKHTGRTVFSSSDDTDDSDASMPGLALHDDDESSGDDADSEDSLGPVPGLAEMDDHTSDDVRLQVDKM